MKTTNHARVQFAVAVLSFVFLAGVATSASNMSAPTTAPQSFIGTAPNAAVAEALPPTF